MPSPVLKEALPFTAEVDPEKLRDELCERFPLWSQQIRLLSIEESLAARPTDNDGHVLYLNSRILRYFTPETRLYYIAREFLHLQLCHHARGRDKKRRLWRMATEAVVNPMLNREGFQLPDNALSLEGAEEKSAEELYELLLAQLNPDESEEEDDEGDGEAEPLPESRPQPASARKEKGKSAGNSRDSRSREISDPGLATVIAGLGDLLEPSLQQDYDWFPGSTVRHGVLADEFRPYPVAYAEVLLDTSASVDEELLRAFVRGVMGLLSRDAVLRVGCFDTAFYGFQEIRSEQDLRRLSLSGSGGTNFTVAVNAFTGDAENRIIFTDGFAEMPEQRCDAIWVVYGDSRIHPKGGRVLYVKPEEEKEVHEIDFLIT